MDDTPRIGPVAEPIRLAGDSLILAADRYGDPNGPAVILAHGGGQSRTAWARTARMLAGAGYHAISIDLRGHGDSDWSAQGDYHFDAYVRDFAALISRLGGSAALVGASLGGRAALLTATRHPQMVAALALADVTPTMDETAADDMREFFYKSAPGFTDVDAAADMLEALTPGPARRNVGRLRANLRAEGGRLYWRWDPRFVERRFVGDPDQLAMLETSARTLTAPTIVIRAEHSTVVRAEHVDHFRALAPHVEARVALGIEHMLTGDANDAYAPLILDFFRRTYPV